MALFTSKFFSKAGQKERISNVGSTLKAAVTGAGVQSNTGIKIVDKVLSTAASHPFATAGAVTVISKAPAIATGARNLIAKAGSSVAGGSSLGSGTLGSGTKLGLAAAGGLVAGSLLGGGRGGSATTAPQDLVPTQNTSPSGSSSPNSYEYQYAPNYSTNRISGSPGASIGSSGASMQGPDQGFSQSTIPYQETSASQDATGGESSGGSWLPFLLVAGAAYVLAQR